MQKAQYSTHRFPESAFQRLLGFHVTEWNVDHAILELQLTEHHLNRNGVVHGGLLSTLLDTAMGHSGLYCPYPGHVRHGVTLSLTTNFTAQASSGVLRAIGIRRTGGHRIFSATAEVLDAENRVIALGQGTFQIRRGSEALEGVPL